MKKHAISILAVALLLAVTAWSLPASAVTVYQEIGTKSVILAFPKNIQKQLKKVVDDTVEALNNDPDWSVVGEPLKTPVENTYIIEARHAGTEAMLRQAGPVYATAFPYEIGIWVEKKKALSTPKIHVDMLTPEAISALFLADVPAEVKQEAISEASQGLQEILSGVLRKNFGITRQNALHEIDDSDIARINQIPSSILIAVPIPDQVTDEHAFLDEVNQAVTQGVGMAENLGIPGWKILRQVDFPVADARSLELCHHEYASMALETGAHHLPALPCAVELWLEPNVVYVTILNPEYVFTALFGDIPEEMQNEMGTMASQVRSEVIMMVEAGLRDLHFGYVGHMPSFEQIGYLDYPEGLSDTVRDNLFKALVQSIQDSIADYPGWVVAGGGPLSVLGPVPGRIVEVCSEQYAHMALDTGINHAVALPCEIGIWDDVNKHRFVVNMLNPETIFTLFFADVPPDPAMQAMVQEVKGHIMAMAGRGLEDLCGTLSPAPMGPILSPETVDELRTQDTGILYIITPKTGESPENCYERIVTSITNSINSNSAGAGEWRVARFLNLPVPNAGIIEAGSSPYGTAAVATGIHHIPSLPCEIAVWVDDETSTVRVNVLDPLFVFSAFFRDIPQGAYADLEQMAFEVRQQLSTMVEFGIMDACQ